MSDGNKLNAIWDSPKLEKLLEDGLKSGPGQEWNAEALEKLKQQVLDRAIAKES